MFDVLRLFRKKAAIQNKHTEAKRRCRPSVEMLEDKIVPTTFTPTYILTHDVGAVKNETPAPAGYSPLQLRTAYGVNSTLLNGSLATGAGQTIAIVDAYNDPNIVGDLDTFDQEFSITTGGPTLYAQFGTASSLLTVYNQNGQVINPASSSVPVDSSGGWEVEEALDVEWAHAMAPGAKIDLVEANNAGNSLYTAVQAAADLPGVSVVSMSWGGNEAAGETGTDSLFTTPAGHQGVTFVASTGDSGVGEYPAFSPNVIAVGGTTLTLNASNQIQSETAWSTGSDSWAPTNAGGGGTSQDEPEPSYQESVQHTGFRTIPDVAMDADPATGVAMYDSYKNSPAWIEVGGTSVAAPSFAGLMAVANQERVATGGSTFNSSTNPQQALTAIYSLPSSNFFDVTSGSVKGAGGKAYSAGPGYDEATGFGSPVANNMIPGLAAYSGGTNPTNSDTLAFTTEPPASIVAGTSFSTVVQLESSTGSFLSQAGVSITITLSTGTFSSGATTELATTNSAGQATFNVVVNAPGSYTLTASAPSATGAQSTSFTETATATASKLAFTTEPPSSVAVGTPFTTVVQLESSSSTAVATAGVSVTLTLSTGTFGNGSATLTALTNSSGLATFNAIITAAGTSYTVTASAAGLASAASSTFAVTSSASKIAFITAPPSNVSAGAVFTTTVQLESASGAVVPQSAVTVTLTIAPGPFSTNSTTMTAVTNSAGQATFTVTVSAQGNDTLVASATGLASTPAAAITVSSGDWFSEHISDPVLQPLARADFTRDGAITYSDMLGLFAAAEAEGATVSATTFASLQALADDAAYLNMPAYVAALAGKLINGDPANATYQYLKSNGAVVTISLGNLQAGSTAAQLADLVDKWFLGMDEPTAGANYSAASGGLFGPGGPSFTDVYQGDLGDCTLLASVAEVAALDNTAIQNMFVSDGTHMINGQIVGIWTVRFFENGTPTYVTVDSELPAGGRLYDTPESGVLWVALAEKAYVELNHSGWLATLAPGVNSYGAINSGDQATIVAALSALTGLSTSDFSMSANTVTASLAAGELVVLATGNPASRLIVPDHAYAVIGYNPSASLPFEVFNPWGISAMQYGVYGEFVANATFMNQNFIFGVSTASISSANGFGAAGQPQQSETPQDTTPQNVEATAPPSITIDVWAAKPAVSDQQQSETAAKLFDNESVDALFASLADSDA